MVVPMLLTLLPSPLARLQVQVDAALWGVVMASNAARHGQGLLASSIHTSRGMASRNAARFRRVELSPPAHATRSATILRTLRLCQARTRLHYLALALFFSLSLSLLVAGMSAMVADTSSQSATVVPL